MNDLLNTDSGESSVTGYEWIWWTTAKTLQYLKGNQPCSNRCVEKFTWMAKMLWTSETASEHRGGVYDTTNMDQVRQIQIVSQNTVGDY